MQAFKDHDPSNPWSVTGESHVIDSNGKVRLNYVPLLGSVTISGYTETTVSSPGLTEFYIDYQAATSYRTALGYVQFSLSAAGAAVSVNYSGVSQVLWASTMEEVRTHVGNDAVHFAQNDIRVYPYQMYGFNDFQANDCVWFGDTHAAWERGDVAYYGNNAWQVLHHGDDGQYLTSRGHGNDPVWTTAATGSYATTSEVIALVIALGG